MMRRLLAVALFGTAVLIATLTVFAQQTTPAPARGDARGRGGNQPPPLFFK
jgi:hypothetical protein